MSTHILVGIDRDGTINYDDEGYYGKDDDWKERFRFCPGVIEGLKLLSDDPNIVIAVLTDQVGIAKGVLTCERVEEVNRYIDNQLRENGINIQSWQYNPFSLQEKADYWIKKGVATINYQYIVSNSDPRRRLIKPGIGLLERAAEELDLNLTDQRVYVVGNRLSDVLTGINAGGVGILVNNPQVKTRGLIRNSVSAIDELLKKPIYKGRVYMVTDMIQAAGIIQETSLK